MSGKTSIEWTDRNWPFARGCERVSPGCQNCYAERMASRFSDPGLWAHGFANRTPAGPRWTGRVEFQPQELATPLRVRKPSKFFPSTIDPFHEGITDLQLAAVFGVMAAAPRHTFQILTKRPEHMRAWFAWAHEQGEELLAAVGERPPSGSPIPGAMAVMASERVLGPNYATACNAAWPLPNVWLGVSVEDQQRADERIVPLLQTPAAVRWISAEPLLGPLNLEPYLYVPTRCRACGSSRNHYEPNPRGLPTVESPAAVVVDGVRVEREPGTCLLGAPLTGEPGATRCSACGSYDVEELDPLSWVVTGAESGPGARPMDEDWVRSLRDQCVAADVRFFYKQKLVGRQKVGTPELDGRTWTEMPEAHHVR